MRTLKREDCAVLPLVLKRKWFDMIACNRKREEYRDKKDYWTRRMSRWVDNSKFHKLHPVVEFRLGYASSAPRMAFVSSGFYERDGCYYPEWGEWPELHYFIPLEERVELED